MTCRWDQWDDGTPVTREQREAGRAFAAGINALLLPKRIQRRRTKGWRMPPNTVSVTRPSIFGNKFRVVNDGTFWWCMIDRSHGLLFPTERGARRQATMMFREQIEHGHEAEKNFLRGKNLACFCGDPPEGVPDVEWCHAAVWLEVVNADLIEGAKR